MSDFYFDKLKKKIFNERGFDLNQYTEEHVKRRINIRIMSFGLNRDSYREYIKILEENPNEYNLLFDIFNINVTEFFRDISLWEVLEKKFLKEIIESKKDCRLPVLRIWSCGCSTGEEPYSIAILLNELLNNTKLLSKTKFMISIIATDIDTDAINKAQNGIYSERSLKNMINWRPSFVNKYFVPTGDSKNQSTDNKYHIANSIKKMVIFKIHNAISDTPYHMMDMIFCRNMTIYLKPETRDKIIEIFYNSLINYGVLVTGKSEIIFVSKKKYCFFPVDLKEHIYKKERRKILQDKFYPENEDKRKNFWFGKIATGEEIEKISCEKR